MKARRSNRSAFTLIETLAAFTILGIVMATTYALLSNVSASARMVRNQGRTRRAQALADVIAEDLVGCRAHVTEEGAFTGRKLIRSGDRRDPVSFTTVVGRQMSFIEDADAVEVTYRVREVTDAEATTLVLERREVPAGQPTSRYRFVRFARDLLVLKLRYYDGAEWADEFTATEAMVMPMAISIDVECESEGDVVTGHRLVVPYLAKEASPDEETESTEETPPEESSGERGEQEE